LTKREVKTFIC